LQAAALASAGLAAALDRAGVRRSQALVSVLSEEAQSKRRRVRSRLVEGGGREQLTGEWSRRARPERQRAGRRTPTRSLLLVLQSRWSLRLGLTECL
jgi:hypothetical protein